MTLAARLLVALLLAATSLVSAPAQCAGPSCHVLGGGNLSDGNGGPLLTGHIYLVQAPVTVPAGLTLTIQPGAIVKFDSSGSTTLPLSVDGSLVAAGTAGLPIYFTSVHDDVGGDTNGSTVQPAAGDWRGIGFGPASGSMTANLLDHCVIRYAGKGGSDALRTMTSSLTISSTVFASCDATALDLAQRAKPAITGCTITGCDRPAERVPLNALTGFSGNVASGCTTTDAMSVTFDGSSTMLSGSPTWGVDNTMSAGSAAGVVIMEISPVVPAGAVLTLGAGLILKGASFWQLNLGGDLVCNGTAAAPVVFTVVDDVAPVAGGLTVAGRPGPPSPGAWGGLNLGPAADASVLDHVVVRYGGGNGQPGAITLAGADATVTNATVSYSATAGLSVAGADPVVSDSSFVDGDTAVVGLPITALASFTGNSASGNASGDLLVLGGGTLSTALTLGPANALATPTGPGPFALAGSLSVAASGHLTIAPSTVIKVTGSYQIAVSGTLTAVGAAGSEIVFTSIEDPAHGGVTSPNPPAPGDWRGIKLNSGADASVLSYVLIRYAGSNQSALTLDRADIAMNDCAIEHSAGPGLDLFQQSVPLAVDACRFDDCTLPVVEVPLAAVASFTACTATGNSGGDYMQIRGAATITGAVTLSVPHTMNQSGIYVFDSNITVGATGRLTLDPMVIVKMAGSWTVSVSGALDVPQGPAWITSLADDGLGGDTANDGPSSGSPGDWRQVVLTGAPILENLTIRFAGASGVPAVNLQPGAAGLDQVTVESCAGPGLAVAGGVRPAVTRCEFNGNDQAMTPMSILTLQGFDANRASGNTQGDTVHIDAIGGGGSNVLGPAQSFGGSGVFVLDGSVTMTTGSDLTFQPGTILKVAGPFVMALGGPLHLRGDVQSPVVITSIHDDDHGGDTNMNGAATTPAPGDWGQLAFSSVSDLSVVRDALIRYAGAGNPAPAAVDLESSDISMTRVTIEKCAGTAIHAHETSTPYLTDCRLTCNGGKAIDGVTWALLGNTSGLVATGNAGDDGRTEIFSPLVVGDVEISHASYVGDAIVVHVSPVIDATNSLTLGEGVIIKAAAPDVRFDLNDRSGIHGTANLPVIFTSIADDEHGGDTNGDQNATAPAPGDWDGIECTQTPLVEHTLIRYAGWDAVLPHEAALQGQASRVNAARVEHGLGDGMHVRAVMTNSVAFMNGVDGIRGSSISYCTSAFNGGVGIRNGFGMNANLFGCNAWGNGVSNYTGYFLGLPSPPASFFVLSIVWCNGFTDPGPCPPTTFCTLFEFNNDVDPLFVDVASGDLMLQGTSPCLDQIPLTSTGPSGTVHDGDLTRRDADGRSRQIDSGLNGPAFALSDIGAYERSLYSLVHTGLPRTGSTITFSLAGPAGFGVLLVGNELGSQPAPPYGFLLAGTSTDVLVAATVSVGQVFSAPLPPLPQLAGFAFSVQGLGLLAANPARGAFTNIWRGTIYS